MGRIRYIDGLRGIFALAVAIFHFDKYLIFPGAYLAVDFFFVLSGFILSYVYLPRVNKITHWDFIRTRLARLWPLHVATLLLYIVINSATYFFMNDAFRLHPDWRGSELSSFFENVFLIHNVGLQNTLTWNYPSWSISVEFWVNIVLFSVLVALLKPSQKFKTTFTLILVVLTSYILLENSLPHLGGKPAIVTQIGGILNVGLLRGFGGIFLGVLVFQLTMTIGVNRRFSMPAIVFKSAIEIGLLALIFYHICFHEKSETDITIIFFFSLLLTILSIGQNTLLRWLLSMKVFTFLGTISYGIYLCHAPILQFFKRWEMFFGDSFNQWAVATIFTTTVILVSTFAYYFVERPGQRMFIRTWDNLFKSRAT